MVNTADISDTNRLEHSMSEDLDPKWSEPATRGENPKHGKIGGDN